MSDKVWEETWGTCTGGPTDDATLWVVIPDDGEALIASFDPEDTRRARLAASAPEAVRLLLEAEEADNSDGEYTPRCPWCANKTYGAPDGKSGIPTDFHPGKHADDCKWLALMKKAGVR